MQTYQLFATTPKALEGLLVSEIEALGGRNIQPTLAGASFTGDLSMAYKACLWLRTASRVFLRLAEFPVSSQQDLYAGASGVDWSEHLQPDASLAVSCNVKNNPAINHSHFGALKVKDAIVDQMRARHGQRPNIDTERPDLRVNLYLHNTEAQLYLDLSGSSLHQRGIRETTLTAPIKENLAAAILLRADWPKIAAGGGSLLDPMCGSATLLIEGAMIAADCAPGLSRDYFGFLGWKQHDPALWRELLTEAEQRRAAGLLRLPVIAGFDQDPRAVAAAVQHVANAGLTGKIHIEKRDIGRAAPAASWPTGLVICNPPYGERLGDPAQAAELYRRFGDVLKTHFPGWRAAMIISDQELGFRLGLRSQKPITVFNGALECKLLRFNIEPAAFFTPKPKTEQEQLDLIKQQSQQSADPHAEMFGNRLRKNLKKLESWRKREQIDCFRLYDADLPEYAVAVDVYQGEQTWVNVQEYAAPKTIPETTANLRLASAVSEIGRALQIPPQQIFLKIRRKQKQLNQYEKLQTGGEFHVVQEGGCKFWVNFSDYLDTGLFLDHRPMRLKLQQQARGKRFLNLFAYTASASVHAIKGGASASLSIDMSNTYLEWAERNYRLNGIQGDHKLLRADCMQWLDAQNRLPNPAKFDLIFLDPPTFSNSKKMDETFDVQNDHVTLIRHACALLNPGGVLYFSTNFRRFKLDRDALAALHIEDIGAASIPPDFSRDLKIHYCWRISP